MGQVRLDSPAPRTIYTPMLLRNARPRPNGFNEPCLPSPALTRRLATAGIHEIRLDGFRMLARRDGAGVRLLTRRGIDWTTRYPSIAAAVAALACRSCLIDEEVVICGEMAFRYSTGCAMAASRNLRRYCLLLTCLN